MNIHRNSFFENFAPATPSLQLIFLNHLGAPAKLLNDISTIDLLAEKKSKAAFINYCKSHPLVKGMIITNQFRVTNILVEFLDGSEIRFSLLDNMVRRALLCLNPKAIQKESTTNDFGMLVPCKEHHFEYMTLKCQFNKDPLSERYNTFFATYEFHSRAAIFKFMQKRYNLIYNTLEDLYKPKPNYLLSIMIGLRGDKENTLFRMFIRTIGLALFNLFGFYTKRAIHIKPTPVKSSQPTSPKKSSAGQAIL
jgi:hypothetical protein